MSLLTKKVILSFLLSSALLGCSANERQGAINSVPEITPTTGVFSANEEAFYEDRLKDMLAAFRSGMATTIYDTTVEFGMEREARPLPRSKPEKITQDLLTGVYDYVSPMNSALSLIHI